MDADHRRASLARSLIVLQHRYLIMFIKPIIRQVRELVLASARQSPVEYLDRILEAARTIANNQQRPATARIFALLKLWAWRDWMIRTQLIWAVVFDHPLLQQDFNEGLVFLIESIGPLYQPWRAKRSSHHTRVQPWEPKARFQKLVPFKPDYKPENIFSKVKETGNFTGQNNLEWSESLCDFVTVRDGRSPNHWSPFTKNATARRSHSTSEHQQLSQVSNALGVQTW
ncbi:hypothetical protein M409DRAFT_21171 [Zasmidium cellare ATCC 36951]|uniref:Uncharacterized protein n=1 Tax=Zasmidium cellare ATCC 36951 TaxID=1080233 RepID=A0A6A6CN01_ZASCE|nr:uncharacterized protein M409DRAFT_21171 [Zasmidium cellare ATCC 36951]KAF2168421.1 hypothetical protein M409DRAFT_21171 [Zasmidium cellare ATCC 36951]